MKFFALMLMLGGASGVVIAILIAGQALALSWLYILMIVPFTGLFAWSIYTGTRLWRGDRYGRKWAPLLFASQIPIIVSPAATAHWFTGAQFGPAFKFAADTIEASLSLHVGANGQFFVGSGGSHSILGINVFAAIALIYLLRSNRALKVDRKESSV